MADDRRSSIVPEQLSDRGKARELALLKRSGKADTIHAEIHRRIVGGHYDRTGTLGTHAALCVEFDASNTTMAKVLDRLAGETLIDRKRGPGGGITIRRRVRVVRNLALGVILEHQQALAELVDLDVGLFEQMTGVDITRLEIRYAVQPAPERAAQLLGVPAGAFVLERTLHYELELGPYQVVRSYMSKDTAAAASLTGPESERKGEGTILQLRRAGIELDRVDWEWIGRQPSPDEVEVLRLSPGTPVVEVWRLLYPLESGDSGPAVEVSYGVVPAELVQHRTTVPLSTAAVARMHGYLEGLQR